MPKANVRSTCNFSLRVYFLTIRTCYREQPWLSKIGISSQIDHARECDFGGNGGATASKISARARSMLSRLCFINLKCDGIRRIQVPNGNVDLERPRTASAVQSAVFSFQNVKDIGDFDLLIIYDEIVTRRSIPANASG